MAAQIWLFEIQFIIEEAHVFDKLYDFFRDLFAVIFFF